jgi:hypothetical protein
VGFSNGFFKASKYLHTPESSPPSRLFPHPMSDASNPTLRVQPHSLIPQFDPIVLHSPFKPQDTHPQPRLSLSIHLQIPYRLRLSMQGSRRHRRYRINIHPSPIPALCIICRSQPPTRVLWSKQYHLPINSNQQSMPVICRNQRNQHQQQQQRKANRSINVRTR